MVSRCVWSRNLVNEEALAHWRNVAPKANKQADGGRSRWPCYRRRSLRPRDCWNAGSNNARLWKFVCRYQLFRQAVHSFICDLSRARARTCVCVCVCMSNCESSRNLKETRPPRFDLGCKAKIKKSWKASHSGNASRRWLRDVIGKHRFFIFRLSFDTS